MRRSLVSLRRYTQFWWRPAVRVQITPAAIHAAVWRHGTPRWEASWQMDGGGIYEGMTALLQSVPRSRWGRGPVSVAVHTGAARVKHLRQLPAIGHAGTLEAVIRENARRFFLWDTPFVTSHLRMLSDTEAMCAAVSTSVLDMAVTACAATGYTLRDVHPAGDPDLAVYPRRAGGAAASVPRWRSGLAATAFVVAFVSAVLSPGFAARATAHRAAARLAALARSRSRAAAAADELHRTGDALDTIAGFAGGRHSVTRLLAALAATLPPKSAVTDLQIDSTSVNVVVVAERAAAVLSTLDHIPGVVAPEIIGPVSHEALGTTDMERATIHFQYEAAHSARAERIPYAMRHDPTE